MLKRHTIEKCALFNVRARVFLYFYFLLTNTTWWKNNINCNLYEWKIVNYKVNAKIRKIKVLADIELNKIRIKSKWSRRFASEIQNFIKYRIWFEKEYEYTESHRDIIYIPISHKDKIDIFLVLSPILFLETFNSAHLLWLVCMWVKQS